MERRKFVVGLGALASGSAAAMGTGAFSSVTADRTVNFAVADDSNAFLKLTSGNSDLSEYVDETGDTITVNLDETDAGGAGLNPDAVTTFDNLLEIGNQGSQDVEVTISDLGSYSEYITVDDDGDNNYTSSDGVTIEKGNSKNVNVEVDLEDFTGDQDASLTVTFTAEAVDSS